MALSPRAFVLVALLLTSCSGSNDSLSPVTGKVSVGGKPAVGAMLVFHSDGPPDAHATPATAKAGVDGTFTMNSGLKTGAKPGKYIVTVVWPDPAKKFTDMQIANGANPEDAPDLLGGRYATREKSTLRAEIKAGATALEPFDLK